VGVLTDKEQHQRNVASQKAKYKRDSMTYSGESLELLEDLITVVQKLQKVNAPPLKLPTGTNASVVEVNRPRSVEPNGDTQINKFFDELRIILSIQKGKGRQLLKEKR